MSDVGMIVAVAPNGVIGIDGEIPWHYPADLKRFKRLTLDSTIIMGRRTFESIGRPLPKRRNVVITSRPLDVEGVETFRDIPSALASCAGPVWFIGGARIYEEAMAHVDRIDVTYVPDEVDAPDAARFPEIDPARFEAGPRETHPDDPRLELCVYSKKTA